MPSMCMSVLFTSCMQCSPFEELVCPEPLKLVVSGNLGYVKLSFGKLIFCRKTKAEAMAEELKKKGLVNQEGGSCSKTGNLHAIHSV